MLESLDWGNVLSIVLGLVATVATGAWAVAKGKLTQLKNVAKEGYEAIQTVVEAAADDKFTSEELVNIKVQALEAWAAIKTLLGIKK